MSLLELASKQNSILALLKLGDCYYYGDCGVNVNFGMAFQYYMSVAMTGISDEGIEAKYNLYIFIYYIIIYFIYYI